MLQQSSSKRCLFVAGDTFVRARLAKFPAFTGLPIDFAELDVDCTKRDAQVIRNDGCIVDVTCADTSDQFCRNRRLDMF
eukprot:1883697-Amphidinium_carterae.2